MNEITCTSTTCFVHNRVNAEIGEAWDWQAVDYVGEYLVITSVIPPETRLIGRLMGMNVPEGATEVYRVDEDGTLSDLGTDDESLDAASVFLVEHQLSDIGDNAGSMSDEQWINWFRAKHTETVGLYGSLSAS